MNGQWSSANDSSGNRRNILRREKITWDPVWVKWRDVGEMVKDEIGGVQIAYCNRGLGFNFRVVESN